MPADFTEIKEYFNGLLIEGGPYELSQHISQILASGAHFQYIDGNVIEVIRPGKDEVIVWNSGATYSPPPEVVAESREVEEVAPLQELAPLATPIAPVLEEVLSPAEDLAAVEEVVPEPASKPRGRKPSKAVEAEEAPAEVPVPAEVEESE